MATSAHRGQIFALLSFVCLVGTVLCSPATLSEHRLLVPERGEVSAFLLTVDSNRFSFIAPPGWRTSCKPGTRTVVMLSDDLAKSMTIEFLDTDIAIPSSRERNHQMVAARYPDATVRETFTCRTGLGKGRAFDLARKGADKIRLTSRVVYVSRQWGTIEFALTVPGEKSPDCLTLFDNVVNSFQRPVR